jgi:electron transport complex protein RnfG
MKELVPLVVALTIIAAVAALGLALVFSVTEEPMRQADLKKVRDSITAVLPPFVNTPDDKETNPDWITSGDYDFFLGKDESGNIIGIAFIATSKEGYGGTILTMVGLTPEGAINKIFNVSHRETPGLGSKIKDAWFLEQFENATLENKTLYVRKDNAGSPDKPPIDSITGATISSRAVADSVREGLIYFLDHQEEIMIPTPEPITETEEGGQEQ